MAPVVAWWLHSCLERAPPPVVKRTDRRLFTLSVLFVLFSEWVFVAYPHHVWLLYAVIFVPLALFRIHRYNAKKWATFSTTSTITQRKKNVRCVGT